MKPATSAASMTIGMARSIAPRLRSVVKGGLTRLARGRTASGSNVSNRQPAPTAKGCQPRVPVTASTAGPSIVPAENTVP
jgi:hypothetical protein